MEIYIKQNTVMGRTKEFLDNFVNRWGEDSLERLQREMEIQEMEWYFENSEKPYVAYDNDYDSSVTEQGI